MNNPSFGDAISKDKRLFTIASYDAFDGIMPIPKTGEQVAALQLKAIQRFNYFKKLVKDGEATIEQLEDMVAARSGAFPKRKFSNEEEAIQNVLDKSANPLIETPREPNPFSSLLQGIMDSLASEENGQIRMDQDGPLSSSFKVIPLGPVGNEPYGIPPAKDSKPIQKKKPKRPRKKKDE